MNSMGEIEMQIVCILGKSGSGKSTLERSFEQLGYKRIISYTTRQIRGNEIDHVDYHFVTKQQFKELLTNGNLVEWAEYNNELYGCPKPVGSNKFVVVVETDGFKMFKQLYGNQVVGIYIDTSDLNISTRLNQRNDLKNKDIQNRNIEDSNKFDKSEFNPDFTIDGNKSKAEILAVAMKHVIEWRNKYNLE